jgi:hypothetical protein
MIERNFNLVQYTRMPRGGHFGCFEQPQLFVDDLRTFFRKLRWDRPMASQRSVPLYIPFFFAASINVG